MTAPQPRANDRGYPDSEGHRRRWRRLARDIATRTTEVTDDPALLRPTATPGRLDILGSGIEAAGFSRADEARIRAADCVFYCVADPATKVWLLTERPDAYDLYVLYDDSKKRYLTYMQMAEAMLHRVRQGKHVVAVFYGHPGVFVLSTHRAITIARREGHRAEMRAAVSALDTLCADLGVDPSQPGMQMFEATDMLIRSRRPDPGLHLVLWQVGLIGELGYRRQGYLNTNFGVLLDYIEAVYGPDHPVVNYVGSRYPGIDPLIQPTTISGLRDPLAQSWVTGISTFYLPPHQAARSDPAMLERLGLIRPGQPVRGATGPLREIDRYGPRELRAFADFAGFDVPASYQWQPDTAASRFVLALCEDEDLRRRYRADPAATVTGWPGLTPRERDLLARRDPGAAQLAAKGSGPRSSGNRAALDHLLLRKTATAALSRAVATAPKGGTRVAAATWARGAGLSIDWPSMGAELTALVQSSLPTWSGLYLDGTQHRMLSVFGRSGRSGTRVDLDGVRLSGVVFQKGTLTWAAEAGNATSGYLQADLSPKGARRFTGLIWAAGETAGSGEGQARLNLQEHVSRPAVPACVAVGDYATPDGGLRIVPDLDRQDGVRAVLGDITQDGVAVEGQMVGVGTLRLPLRLRQPLPAPLWADGDYRLVAIRGSQAEILPFGIAGGRARIAGRDTGVALAGEALEFDGGPEVLARGRLTFTLDPVTLVPLVHGTGQSAGGTPVTVRGMMVVDAARAARLAATPRLGLPDWAWPSLVDLMTELSQRGGLFLWHGQDRARYNLMRLRKVLAMLRRDEIDAEDAP